MEAIRGEKTVAELCAEYGVVSSQLFKWKKVLLDQGSELFKSGALTPCDDQKNIDQLFRKCPHSTLPFPYILRKLHTLALKVKSLKFGKGMKGNEILS